MPSDLHRPVGSRVEGIWADANDLLLTSLNAEWRDLQPALLVQAILVKTIFLYKGIKYFRSRNKEDKRKRNESHAMFRAHICMFHALFAQRLVLAKEANVGISTVKHTH